MQMWLLKRFLSCHPEFDKRFIREDASGFPYAVFFTKLLVFQWYYLTVRTKYICEVRSF